MKKNHKNKIFNKGNVIKMLGGTTINTLAFAVCSYFWFDNVGMPTILEDANVLSLIIWFVPIFFILFFMLRLAEEFIFQNNNK